jgi:hypothetical protein
MKIDLGFQIQQKSLIFDGATTFSITTLSIMTLTAYAECAN